jgi:hypothetical protein
MLTRPAAGERVEHLMKDLDLNGSRDIELRDFLYCLVNLGAGKQVEKRCLLLPGASYDDAFRVGLPLEELWDLGYDDLAQLRKSGWSCSRIKRAKIATVRELRDAGYSLVELRRAGCAPLELKLAGFSLGDIRVAGFSREAINHCCQTLGASCIDTRRSDEELFIRPLTDADAETMPESQRFGEGRWWSTPRIQGMLANTCRNRSMS